MTARSAFDRLGTAAKLLLLLTLVMLPIGGMLMWSALHNLQSASDSISAVAGQQVRASVRAMDSLIARNALALRVAANAAAGKAAEDACTEAARSLEIAPAVARQFQIEGPDGTPLCANGNFSDIVNPPRTSNIRVWSYQNQNINLKQGDEMGKFLLGSTVVMLFEKDTLKFNEVWQAERAIKLGEVMATKI